MPTVLLLTLQVEVVQHLMHLLQMLFIKPLVTPLSSQRGKLNLQLLQSVLKLIVELLESSLVQLLDLYPFQQFSILTL